MPFTLARYIVTAGLAFTVTFALFYLMQMLISTSGTLDTSKRTRFVDFIRLKKEAELVIKKRELPNKVKPDEPPPPPDLVISTAPILGDGVAVMAISMDVGLDLTGGVEIGAAGSDSDAIPIVRVQPQYPLRAAERRIEGWVELEFTITAAGTVKDPVVTNSHPGAIFNKSALRAVRKWKYNPKIENGVAVERAGIRVRLTYRLDDDEE